MKNSPMRWFMSKTTKDLYDHSRQRKEHTFTKFLHGYIYARFPYLYIGMGKGDHPWRKRVEPLITLWNKINPPLHSPGREHDVNIPSHTHADEYHGKAIPLQTAKELVSIKEPIQIEDLERVVPYTQARAIIMENPDHIAVLDCPCRAYVENPCLPMDVCLIVGEPFASFIVEHQPQKSRWITQSEAIQILEAEDQRGHVHHAFFKEAMLGRFYAICNCCDCCCGAMMYHKQGVPMLASSGYLAEIDQDVCLQCGNCHDYCQFAALKFSDSGENQVDTALCMGCGICVSKCDQSAIELVLAPHKGQPLEIGVI